MILNLNNNIRNDPLRLNIKSHIYFIVKKYWEIWFELMDWLSDGKWIDLYFSFLSFISYHLSSISKSQFLISHLQNLSCHDLVIPPFFNNQPLWTTNEFQYLSTPKNMNDEDEMVDGEEKDWDGWWDKNFQPSHFISFFCLSLWPCFGDGIEEVDEMREFDGGWYKLPFLVIGCEIGFISFEERSSLFCLLLLLLFLLSFFSSSSSLLFWLFSMRW